MKEIVIRRFSALGGVERVNVVQFILGRWVEAVGMCLREGDNVATRNPRSSAETWHASISLQQLELFKLRAVLSFFCLSHVIYSQCHVYGLYGFKTALFPEPVQGKLLHKQP